MLNMREKKHLGDGFPRASAQPGKSIYLPPNADRVTVASLAGSGGKESACNAGEPGSIPGLGRAPGEGNGYPLQYSCLENPRGQRSLAGYSPWAHKESEMTEH